LIKELLQVVLVLRNAGDAIAGSSHRREALPGKVQRVEILE
jgi:hypothetical protein